MMLAALDMAAVIKDMDTYTGACIEMQQHL